MTQTYFHALGDALRSEGLFRPTLVIDRSRLDANVARTRAAMPPGRVVRLVDKSLASLPLIAHLRAALTTNRLMSFHLPITRAVLSAFPDSEVLFGKPMPAPALEHFFRTATGDEAAAFSANVVHLVDTVERLQQYGAVAAASGRTLRFAAEIDVGMHRGGFASREALRQALAQLSQHPLLKCEGVMAYEAHIPAIPGLFGGKAGEKRKVVERFNAFVAVLGPDQRHILNTGGSKTAVGYPGDYAANEVSMGSGFLQPTDFEGGELSALEPALFIATPVLKVGGAQLPGPPFMTALLQKLGRFPTNGCFTYGGKWMASPCFPIGISENGFWGESSNQQFFGLPPGSDLKVDDYLFFRPTQSEAVLQQFGPIAVFDGNAIVDYWAPLPVG